MHDPHNNDYDPDAMFDEFVRESDAAQRDWLGWFDQASTESGLMLASCLAQVLRATDAVEHQLAQKRLLAIIHLAFLELGDE